MYCFVFGFNTHNLNQELSNLLLGVFWIFAYSSFYCYLMAIEVFLKEKIKILIVPKIYCLFLCLAHILNIATVILFDWNFLFVANLEQSTLFAQTMAFTISPSIGTLSLGAVGAIMVIFSGITILSVLNKRDENEYMLKLGILVTIFCVLNDSALGLELSGTLIPFYYFGNAFEAFRLNLFYQNKAYSKIHSLEEEVSELTKIAQFGTAAASISHDIRNYLMIIQISLMNALRGKDVEANIEKSLNYVRQSGDVTKIYMDLFKHSSELKLTEHKLMDIVQGAYDLLEERLEKSRVEFILDVPEEISIKCNDIAFTLALVNLVGNAIEEVGTHTHPWVKLIYNKESKAIEVIDSGKGIPEDIAKHIFELNFSTKKSDGGSGLGLAITKQIIEKCGFQIDLARDRENTTFVISTT
jgi:signal transduction histidine kinase